MEEKRWGEMGGDGGEMGERWGEIRGGGGRNLKSINLIQTGGRKVPALT